MCGTHLNPLLCRYNKACTAKKERASKSSQSFGAKGTRGGHPAQVLLSIIMYRYFFTQQHLWICH